MSQFRHRYCHGDTDMPSMPQACSNQCQGNTDHTQQYFGGQGSSKEAGKVGTKPLTPASSEQHQASLTHGDLIRQVLREVSFVKIGRVFAVSKSWESSTWPQFPMFETGD